MAANDYKIVIKAILDDTTLRAKVEGICGKNSELKKSYDNIAGSANKMTKTAGEGMDRLNHKQNNMGKGLKDFANGWVNITKKVVAFGAATAAIGMVKQAIGAMVDNVKILDNSLVQLQKVTDLQGDSLKDFTDRAFEAGKTVARTGSEMIDAATEFARAGFSNDQALELGRIASLYQNIADEEVSAADSASMIIAMTKAFKNEGLSAIEVIDKVNEVSNRWAVSSADVAAALPKVASTLALAGNTADEAMGLLTAGTEMMPHQASRVARGLRSITLNLQGMTAEGDKSLTLTAKMEKSFSKIGMTLKDETTGQLKSTFDILKELSGKWKDLTPDQQKYYAALIGGKQQVDVVTSVISNFGSAIGATESAMNSAGSAAKENEKYLNSIKGKTAMFNSEFQKMSAQLIDSDFVKGVVDFGTGLIKVMTAADGALPKLILFGTTLWGVSKAFMFIKGSAIPGLLGQGAKLLTWLKKVPVAFAIAGAYGEGFGGVLKLLNIELLPWIALAGAITAVGIALYKNVPNLEDNEKQFEKNETRIGKLNDALDKLHDKEKDGKLTTEEKRRQTMYEIERDLLIEQDKILQRKIDKQVLLNQKIAIQNGLTGKTESYSKTDLLTAEYETGVKNYNRSLTLAQKAYDDYLEHKKKGQDELAALDLEEYNRQKDAAQNNKVQYLDALKSLGDIKASIEATYEGREDTMPPAVKSIIESIDKTIDGTEKLTDVWTDFAESVTGGKAGDIAGTLENIGDQLDIGFSSDEKVYNLKNLTDLLSGLGLDKDKIAGVIKELSDAGYEWTGTDDTAASILKSLGILDKFPTLKPKTDNSELSKTWSWLDSIKKLWDKLFGTDGKIPASGGNPYKYFAKGGKNLDAGVAEVNEEGWELIKSKDGVRIANGGERGATMINDGDEVIPHNESVKMVNGDKDIKLKGFASGTHSISTAMPSKGHYSKDTSSGFDKSKDTLDHQLAMGYISEQKYYENLTALRNKYYKAGKISLEDSRRIEEEVHDYNEKLKEDAFDKEVKRLEGLQERYSAQQELLNIYAEKQIENIDKKIEGYEKEKEGIEKQNEASEKANALSEAQIKLAEAKGRKIKVYRAGKGFGYEGDTSAVDEAQKELDALKQQYAVDEKIAQIDAKIATAEEEKAKWAEVSSQWQDEQDIKNLEQVAGVTLSDISKSVNGSLATFDKMYSNTGAKLEGYTDALSKTEDSGKIQSTATIESLINSNRHATGTKSAKGGLSLVGEQGAELRVLGRGDGIMPNNITKNLMELGKFSAKELINVGSALNKTGGDIKTEFNFGAGSIVVNGDNAETLAKDIITNMNRIVEQKEKKRN